MAPASGQPSIAGAREHVLPTGSMHLVFRLDNAPLRLFNDLDDVCGYTVGHAVVGGARSTFYVRDVSMPSCSVGAQLHPGAAQLLFGASADEFSGRHARLEDIWGAAAGVARERLLEANSPERQLAVFEALLAARLPQVRGLHPAVAQAIEQMATTNNIHEVVKRSNYSHRHFIALFGQAVGLTPKVYCRLLRFQQALARMAAAGNVCWADLAMICGYSDQAHFNREFREFTGVAPETYRKVSPLFSHHVPIGPAAQLRSISFKTA